MRGGRAPWVSVMSTNLAIAGVVGLLVAVGVRDFLLVHAPISLLASSAGVWLFYVQHQFEHTYWAWGADWNVHTGACTAARTTTCRPCCAGFTANIGIHHVHHLCSRIPCYRLGEVLREHPELQGVSRPTLKESFRCLRLALWDEDKRRLVGFREARIVAGVRTPKRSGSRFVIGVARGRRLSDRSSGREERLRADGRGSPQSHAGLETTRELDAVQQIVRVADAD